MVTIVKMPFDNVRRIALRTEINAHLISKVIQNGDTNERGPLLTKANRILFDSGVNKNPDYFDIPEISKTLKEFSQEVRMTMAKFSLYLVVLTLFSCAIFKWFESPLRKRLRKKLNAPPPQQADPKPATATQQAKPDPPPAEPALG